MKLGYFIEYRGYVGSIEYHSEDELYYGKLCFIEDLINYHAKNVVELYQCYKNAIDNYIEFKEEIGKE